MIFLLTDALVLFVESNEKSRSREERIRIAHACKRKDAEEAIEKLRKASRVIQKHIELQNTAPPKAIAPELTVENFDEKMAALKRKASTNNATAKSKRTMVDPQTYVGKKIAKHFEIEDDNGEKVMSLFVGTVTEYVEKYSWWHIVYEDGDNEDMSVNELLTHIKLYESNEAVDTK
jgi:hypothetical protein